LVFGGQPLTLRQRSRFLAGATTLRKIKLLFCVLARDATF
jgi:hypothetical protein